MIDENNVIKCGIPQGPLVGKALEIAETYPDAASDQMVIDHITWVADNPDNYTDMQKLVGDDYTSIRWAELTEDLAYALIERRKEQT